MAVASRARVRRRLRQFLPGTVPDFEELAEEMGMTPATMRRRLHEEGESYQSIKDQLRRDLAISYLSHSSRSVMDIAVGAGFLRTQCFSSCVSEMDRRFPGRISPQAAGLRNRG